MSAFKSVEDLSGVKGVINNIRIVSKVKPTEIKQKIVSAFERSATVDAEKIQVETSGNKVILRGTVRSWVEKNDAENAAFMAPGVTEVENKLMIDYSVMAF